MAADLEPAPTAPSTTTPACGTIDPPEPPSPADPPSRPHDPPAALGPRLKSAKPAARPRPFDPSNPTQSLLTVLAAAGRATLTNPGLPGSLRRIKDLFLVRDYRGIFASPDLLAAYTVAYAGGRALCYHAVFARIPVLRALLQGPGRGPAPARIVCLGGGCGSELLGIATAWKALAAGSPHPPAPLEIVGVDFGDWGPVWGGLYAALASSYALGPATLDAAFVQQDLLAGVSPDIWARLTPAALTTCFFTFNELLKTSLPATLAFLGRLTAALPVGAGFLVIDSAGSFSHVTVNGKEHGVWNLLDLVFGCGPEVTPWPEPDELDESGASRRPSRSRDKTSDASRKWVKRISDESIWFRADESLRYPIKIQNMRYFVRYYEKLA